MISNSLPLLNYPFKSVGTIVSIILIALHCRLMYYIVMYCIVLYCIVLYCIVLYCIVLYFIVLYCVVCRIRSYKISAQTNYLYRDVDSGGARLFG